MVPDQGCVCTCNCRRHLPLRLDQNPSGLGWLRWDNCPFLQHLVEHNQNKGGHKSRPSYLYSRHSWYSLEQRVARLRMVIRILSCKLSPKITRRNRFAY